MNEYLRKIEEIFYQAGRLKPSQRIEKGFSLVKEFIVDCYSIEKREFIKDNLIISAREHVGVNDSLMKTYYASTPDRTEGIKEYLLESTEVLQVTRTFFLADKQDSLVNCSVNNNSFLNIYSITENINVKRESQKRCYKCFSNRIQKFLNSKEVKKNSVNVKSCLVFGRDFSRSRKEVFHNGIKKNEFIDQLFVVYLPECLNEESIDKIFFLVSMLYNQIDNLAVTTTLQFESRLKSKISHVLPMILSSEISVAKSIRKITTIINEHIYEYTENFQIDEDAEKIELFTTFVTIDYKKENNRYRPIFRVFPETCSKYDFSFPVDKQFAFNQPGTYSFAKYFIYFLSKYKKNPPLSNDFNSVFEKDRIVDNKYEKYLDKTLSSKTNNHQRIHYIVGSSQEKKKTPWNLYNLQEKISNKREKGSSLCYAFRLGVGKIDLSIKNSINGLIVIESSNPYLFHDELLFSISNVISLLGSILESLNLGRFSNDYRDLIRENYYSIDHTGHASEPIYKEYSFRHLTFDLLRTNLAELSDNFILYQQVMHGKNYTIKNKEKYTTYIEGILDALTQKKQDSSRIDTVLECVDKEKNSELFEIYSRCEGISSDGAKKLLHEHRSIQLQKIRIINNAFESGEVVANIITAINDDEQLPSLKSDFIDFIKNCHSCIIWSSWFGAIRFVLMSRFDNDIVGNTPKFRMISPGHSALEILIVNAKKGEEIQQIIKLGETSKLKKERKNYDKYVRYRISEAARMPSNGFSYLCDGKGIFEYGCLLSDLVHYNTTNKSSTLQSFCTPQGGLDHESHNQLQKGDSKKIINDLFQKTLSPWDKVNLKQDFIDANKVFKENYRNKNTPIDNYNLLKYVFRILEYEDKLASKKSNSSEDAKFRTLKDWYQLYSYRKKVVLSSENRFNESISMIFDKVGSQFGIDSTYLFDVLRQSSDVLIQGDDKLDEQNSFYDFAVTHGDMTSHNILLTSDEDTSPPSRSILIDFEQVKPGFVGADVIHLLVSMIVDKSDFKYFNKNYNGDGFLRNAVNNSFEAIDHIENILIKLFIPTQRAVKEFKYEFDFYELLQLNNDDKYILDENGKPKHKELHELLRILNCDEDSVDIEIFVAKAHNDLFRKTEIYSTLSNLLLAIISNKKGKIQKSEQEKHLSFNKFWLLALIYSATVQMIYALKNLMEQFGDTSLQSEDELLKRLDNICNKQVDSLDEEKKPMNPEMASIIACSRLLISLLSVYKRISK